MLQTPLTPPKAYFGVAMGFGGVGAGARGTYGWMVRSVRGVTCCRAACCQRRCRWHCHQHWHLPSLQKIYRLALAQSEIGAANNLKEHADNVDLGERDACRENTDYFAKRRAYWRAMGRFRIRISKLKEKAREDHRKCVEPFRNQAGDCGTTA